jgi:hypothetical protein
VRHFAILLSLFLTLPAMAVSSGSILQVTRKLRMSNAEPLPPKEFYIDVGHRDGTREGDVFEVSRQIPVTDAEGGGDWHLMQVTLGEIRVYLAGETVSYAKVYKTRTPDELPAMDYTAFMVGDQVWKKTSLPFR